MVKELAKYFIKKHGVGAIVHTVDTIKKAHAQYQAGRVFQSGNVTIYGVAARDIEMTSNSIGSIIKISGKTIVDTYEDLYDMQDHDIFSDGVHIIVRKK